MCVSCCVQVKDDKAALAALEATIAEMHKEREQLVAAAAAAVAVTELQQEQEARRAAEQVRACFMGAHGCAACHRFLLLLRPHEPSGANHSQS